MSTPDNFRCGRCSVVVLHVFDAIMQDLMKHQPIPAPVLYKMIMNDRYFRKHKLKSYEMNTIQTLQTEGFSKLDFSIIYKIARYFKGLIPPPTRNWGSNPYTHEIEVGDDVERIHIERHRFVHKAGAEITDREMTDLFVTSIEIGRRIDIYLNKAGDGRYEQEIQNVQSWSMDVDTQEIFLSAHQDIESLRRKMTVLDDGKTVEIYHKKSIDHIVAVLQESVKNGPKIALNLIIHGVEEEDNLLEQLNKLGLENIADTVNIKFVRTKGNPDLLPFAGTSEDFHELLSTGTYKSFENRVFLCGSCACGKSTLASVLIGSPIPLTWKSTDGLVIHFGRNGINLGTYEMVPLKEGGRGQNVLTKVIIGNPNREPIPSCQSVDNQQAQSIEPSSTGTDNSHETPVTNIPPVKRKKNEAYAVHDDILREIKSGQYEMKIAPSDLIDFGGQRSYDMTHQLFIQHGGTFVVMFDGSKDFHEPLEEYPTGDVSNESIVKHWVNSILTYCVDDSDVMPMILFAATHSDLLSEDMQKKKKKELVKKVTEMFGTHERNKHFVFDPVFFINSTDKEDQEIQNLKAQLVSIARNQPSWGQRRPMLWVPLELLINNMKKDNINIIPKTHLAEANTMNGDLALSDKQMDDFLLTQHALGKLMYFNQPELNNFIILYPPALINILRSFVTNVMFWPEDEILRSILRKMTDTGMIYKEDLLKLWQQKNICNHIPDNATKCFIIHVLVHLDVLVLPKRYSGSSDEHVDFYLVPCTVKNKMPMSFLDDKSFANRTISLVYRLQMSSIPSALSFKLIGAVSSIWPIMELNGHPLLYHSSAVLCVDGKTEFRIIVEDTKVIVYLTHMSSKSLISPDIAASIQECLTTTLEVVLKFYLTNIGKSHQNANVSNLFHIEVGEVCDKSPCVVSISKANMNSDWVCDSGNEHSSRYPLLWFFNKTLKECPSNCPGLAETILTKSPSEQDLARFADQLTNSTCRDLVLHLGLELKDWQDIEDCYTGMSLIVRIMALHCWKTKRIKEKPTKSFSNLLDAMKAVEETRHLLCKVFREDTDLLDIADVRLQEIPHDDVLNGLPENLGNCAVQLGIELGITVSSIKETMVRHHKDMYKQISDILRKWKLSRQVKPTIYRLMLALERVDTGGLDYLKKIYIGQQYC